MSNPGQATEQLSLEGLLPTVQGASPIVKVRLPSHGRPGTTRLYEASATRYQGATHAGYMVGDTIAANRTAGREHSGGAAEAEGQAWWNPEKWMPSSVDFWRSL